MQILPTLLAAALGLGCALFVVWPLLKARASSSHGEERGGAIDELREEKDKLLHALKDIDFDHRTGKLSDDDFQRLDAEYRSRALQTLERLEALEPTADPLRAVEADVRRALGEQAPAGPRVCVGCGERIGSSVKFCSNCGQPASSPAA